MKMSLYEIFEDHDLCFLPAECLPGTFSATGYNYGPDGCTPCPKNFYQSLNKSTTCEECAEDKVTSGVGSVAESDCTAGECT